MGGGRKEKGELPAIPIPIPIQRQMALLRQGHMCSSLLRDRLPGEWKAEAPVFDVVMLLSAKRHDASNRGRIRGFGRGRMRVFCQIRGEDRTGILAPLSKNAIPSIASEAKVQVLRAFGQNALVVQEGVWLLLASHFLHPLRPFISSILQPPSFIPCCRRFPNSIIHHPFNSSHIPR